MFKECFGDAFILITGFARIPGDKAILERIGGTMIQIKEGARIENPRNYEPGEVEHLDICWQQVVRPNVTRTAKTSTRSKAIVEPTTFTFLPSAEISSCWQSGSVSRKTAFSAQATSSLKPGTQGSQPPRCGLTFYISMGYSGAYHCEPGFPN